MVEIVIPNWNPTNREAQILKDCLDSLEETRSENETEFSVTVIDNGSVILPDVGDARVIKLGVNYGFSIACNVGAQLAQSEWVLFLNNDLILHGDWLDQLMQSQKRNFADIVGAKLLYKGQDKIQHAGVAFDSEKGMPFHLDYRLSSSFCKEDRVVPAVTGAVMLVRAEIFHGVGGFDKIYVNGAEDTDLCLKVIRAGGIIVMCANVFIEHIECATPGRSENNLKNWRTLDAKWHNFIRDKIGYYGTNNFYSD